MYRYISVLLFASNLTFAEPCTPGLEGCDALGQSPPVQRPVNIETACTTPGHWIDNYNQQIHVLPNLTGTIVMTNGCPPATLLVTPVGTTGFHVNFYTPAENPAGGGGTQCVNWVEDLTWDDCNNASGTYTNPSGSGGIVIWERTGPWLDVVADDPIIATDSRVLALGGVGSGRVLTHSDLHLTVTNNDLPVFNLSFTIKSDRAPGEDTFEQPLPTDGSGQTTAGVATRVQDTTSTIMSADSEVATRTPATITWLPAQYESDFLNTCYVASLESDFADDPNMDTNLPGVPPGHSYHHAFVKDVRMQGSGLALDGTYLHYNSRANNYNLDTCARTATTDCAVDGQTIAVDPHVIPMRGTVSIQGFGSRKAQDTGGAIQLYHIDIYYGTRRTDCIATNHPMRTLDFTAY